jgi:iron complex transport system permease protein
MNRKPGAAVAGMTLVLLTAVLVSLSMGSVRVPVLSVLGQALGLCAQRTGEYATQAYILAQVRLPRIVLCMLTGISLGVGGCVMQTLFRNPLASPFTMGVSSGASFGAALAMVLGVGILQQNFLFTGYSLVAMNAFVFGMISLLLVSAVAKMSRSDMSILILVGTAVNSLFSAGVSVLKYISGAEALKNLESWLMGGFWGANWKAVLVLVPLLAVSVGVLLRMAWDFNAMNAGEETAATMGVPVKWLKRISLGLVTLIASVTIAFSGVIGFIGLIAPHAARSMAGTDNRYLLPASGMMGAIVLLVSDTVSRTILSPKEIPVGIITSLLGVPFFIYILSRRRKQMWG